MGAAATYAATLKGRFAAAVSASRAASPAAPPPAPPPATTGETGTLVETEAEAEADSPEDVLVTHSQAAINTVSKDTALIERIRNSGIPWMGVLKPLEDALPDVLDDRNSIAFGLVPQFMDEVFGAGSWDTEKRPRQSGSGTTTWIVLK